MSPTITGGFSTKNPSDVEKVARMAMPNLRSKGDAPARAVMQPSEPVAPEAEPAAKMSAEDLFKLNKADQEVLIRKLGFKGQIPNLEKDRVKLLEELGA